MYLSGIRLLAVVCLPANTMTATTSKIFKSPIRAYSLFLYLGMVSGLVVSNYVANIREADSFAVFMVGLLLIYPGWLGTRILFYLTRWHELRDRNVPFWDSDNGGASLFGAFPVVIILSIPLCRLFDLGFIEFWDINIYGALTGMAIGRLGCHVHGCCQGKICQSRLSVRLIENGLEVNRYPIQITEAVIIIAIVVTGIRWYSHSSSPGDSIAFAGLCYLVTRGVLDEFKDYHWSFWERVFYRSITLIGLIFACLFLIKTL